MAVVALTGATGFIGGHLAESLRREGHEVRALARRPSAALEAIGVQVVSGCLENRAGLAALLRGADQVVHAAAVIRGRSSAGYHQANSEGTALLAELAAAESGLRFIYISSLAARHPHLSPYARSKANGEKAVLRFSDRLALTIVRPPAVYGPGDTTTFPLMASLSRGWLLAPTLPAARFSLLFVGDLAQLVLALIGPKPAPALLEPDDGRTNGYAWRDLAAIAEASLRRGVRTLALPKGAFLVLASLLDYGARFRDRAFPLSRDRIEELFQLDWVCDASTLAGFPAWRAMTGFGAGLESTIAWYRRAGWL